mmetsp:Transcript_5283/g.9705  ORF Transcript_5283/g.9705 Transcript_5283/m.9705 type:complete len:209 (-) Transcript_5283:491-1117(-)
MSLIALAAIDRSGTPLYLRDYTHDLSLLFHLSARDENIFDDALFDEDDMATIPLAGVEEGEEGGCCGETSKEQKTEWPCQLHYQFTIHAAYERLEDLVVRGPKEGWRVPGASGMDACWVGLLCLSDNLRAYGYVTTNVKYIALVEDAIPPENVQFQTSRDSEICVLMANVHRLYTEHLLNPFSKPQTKITSKRFDTSVTALVESVNGG